MGTKFIAGPRLIKCNDPTNNQPAKTLSEVGMSRIIGREIVSWDMQYGQTGMGGPNFFALRLKASEQFPKEYLVLTLVCSYEWLLFDGKWLTAPSGIASPQNCMIGCGRDYRGWNKVTPAIKGGIISGFVLEEHDFRLGVTSIDKKHEFGITFDVSKLPDWRSPEDRNQLRSDYDLREQWIITSKGCLSFREF